LSIVIGDFNFLTKTLFITWHGEIEYLKDHLI